MKLRKLKNEKVSLVSRSLEKFIVPQHLIAIKLFSINCMLNEQLTINYP